MLTRQDLESRIVELRHRLVEAEDRLAQVEMRAEWSSVVCIELGTSVLDGHRQILAERDRAAGVVASLREAGEAEAERMLAAARSDAATLRTMAAEVRETSPARLLKLADRIGEAPRSHGQLPTLGAGDESVAV